MLFASCLFFVGSAWISQSRQLQRAEHSLKPILRRTLNEIPENYPRFVLIAAPMSNLHEANSTKEAIEYAEPARHLEKFVDENAARQFSKLNDENQQKKKDLKAEIDVEYEAIEKHTFGQICLSICSPELSEDCRQQTLSCLNKTVELWDGLERITKNLLEKISKNPKTATEKLRKATSVVSAARETCLNRVRSEFKEVSDKHKKKLENEKKKEALEKEKSEAEPEPEAEAEGESESENRIYFPTPWLLIPYLLAAN